MGSDFDRPGWLGGLGHAWLGGRYVYVQHRELARYWLPPVGLTLCAMGVLVYAVVSARADIVASLWAMPEGDGWLHDVARLLHRLFEWLAVLVLLVVGGAAVSMLAGVVAAPFNDALSEAVETLETGAAPAPFRVREALRDLGRSVGLELSKLALYAALMGPLLLTSLLVPVVGPVLYSTVGFLFTVLFLALDYVDWPASRRRLPARRRLTLAFRCFPEMFGFGIGVWLLLLIPVVNLLFMPAAVAGGTLLFLRLPQARGPTGPTGGNAECVVDEQRSSAGRRS